MLLRAATWCDGLIYKVTWIHGYYKVTVCGNAQNLLAFANGVIMKLVRERTLLWLRAKENGLWDWRDGPVGTSPFCHVRTRARFLEVI